MGFIEDDDAIFRKFFGDKFRDLGVQEVVVTVDDDVGERHLNGIK